MNVLFVLEHIAVIVGFLLAILVIPQIIRQRRSPAGTIAWLLIVVLFPYIGAPLYLLLGGRKMRRLVERKSQIQFPGTAELALPEAHSLDYLMRSYGIPGASKGNRLELCITGEQDYTNLVDYIETAKHSIHIVMYVMRADEVGRDIVSRLARRAEQGIEVRVLVDKIGSLKTSKTFFAPLVGAGGKVAYFMPMLYRTNLRNHRKMIIVDNRRVIAGGRNIAREYIGPEKSQNRWQDLSFTLEGPAVKQYVELFHTDWEFASGELLQLPEKKSRINQSRRASAKVQVIPSGPDVTGDPLYDAILSMIFMAKQRIWIATPYFVPDDALSQAMRLAAKRGVDVRLLLPRKSNHPLADWARETYVREIGSAGGTIMVLDTMLHAKVILMDDELAVIGSANLDMRSLFLNYEVSLIAYDPQTILAIESWYKQVAIRAEEYIPSPNLWHEMLEGIVRLLAPLL